jgi:glutaredoxin-related protein
MTIIQRRYAKMFFKNMAEMCAVFKAAFKGNINYGFVGITKQLKSMCKSLD